MTTLITTEEWLQAFAEASAPRSKGDSGYRSVTELADAMGAPVTAIRVKIAALSGQGRVVVSKERRPAIDGSMRAVPVYKLKETGKEQ